MAPEDVTEGFEVLPTTAFKLSAVSKSTLTKS